MDLKRASRWIDFSVAIVMWAILSFAMLRVLPVFARIFKDFGNELPFFTKLFVHLGGVPPFVWIAIAAVALLALLLFQLWRVRVLKDDAQTTWDRKLFLAFILFSAALFIFFVLAVFLTESIPLDVIPGNNR